MLKERLRVNIELAAPDQFIPEVPGWRQRSLFIDRVGQVNFHHCDFYSQALAKLERGHERDLKDVRQMIESRLVEPAGLRTYFALIEGQLIRYPAIQPARFKQAVEDMTQDENLP